MKTEEEIIQEFNDENEKLTDHDVYVYYKVLRNDLTQMDWCLDNDIMVSDLQMKILVQRQEDLSWLAYNKRLPKTCEEYKTKARILLEKWNENRDRIAKLPWYKRIFT